MAAQVLIGRFLDETACRNVKNLARDDGTRMKLAQAGACEAVVLALQQADTENMAKEACGAINNLAWSNTENQLKLAKAGACEAIINLFEMENVGFTTQACGTVVSLAAHPDCQRKFVNAGACEAIVNALKLYGMENEQVADYACAAIQNLAANANAQAKFACIGTCEAVVKILHHYGVENTQVAERACGAIRNLAMNAYNKIKMASVGACSAVVETMQRHGADNPKIAVQACGAIWNLGANNAMNQDTLSKVGACEAVVSVLQRYGAINAKVAKQACGAICSLASHQGNNTTGGLERAIKAQRRRYLKMNAKVIARSKRAPRALDIVINDNAIKLGSFGACEAVTNAVQRFGTEDVDVAKLACGAIVNLAMNNAGNRNRFKKAGALHEVSRCLDNYNKDDAANALAPMLVRFVKSLTVK